MPYTHAVLITGGTSGLGYHTTFNIAKQHPNFLVIITGRNDPKSSAKQLNTKISQNNVSFLPLDLSSLSTVRAFAEAWASKSFPPIISLILNAGSQFTGSMELTSDGFEKTFMANHLGHALLFHLLTPYLAPDARIIVTSSGTHDPVFTQKNKMPDAIFTTARELGHPVPETAHPEGMQRYNSSKLANILWTYALAQHLKEAKSRMTVNAFTPGLMFGTGLARDWGFMGKLMWFYILPWMVPLVRIMIPFVRPVEESGKDLAWLALSPETEGISGRYFDGRKDAVSSSASYNVEKQEDLWTWSIKATSGEADWLSGLRE